MAVHSKHVHEKLETGRSPVFAGGSSRSRTSEAIVDLCTCARANPLERLESDDPALSAYLRTTQSVLDLN